MSLKRDELLATATALAAACAKAKPYRGQTQVNVPIVPCVELAKQLIEAVDTEMLKQGERL